MVPKETSLLLVADSFSVVGAFGAQGAIIALINTVPLDVHSFSGNADTFTSTIRLPHPSGSIAATVSKPSGGNAARLPMNFRERLKLQYLCGNSG
jgi:hypothetical protein